MASDNLAGIQAQHKSLEKKIDNVCSTLKNRSGIDELKGQLDDLAGYVKNHSEEEEKLMERYRYRGLELHEREHKHLLDRLFSLREKIYASFEEKHKQALLEFLETDLMEHVIDDMKSWQEGEIDREFVYQRLQDFNLDSAGRKHL